MSKDLGLQAEMRFQLAATMRGLTVSKPSGDNSSYDFILDTGERLLKVQVKSAAYIDPDRPNQVKFQLVKSSSKISYKPHEVDYFALYAAGAEVFFLIPQNLLTGRLSVNITLNGKYKAFKENWCFKEETRSESH